MGKDVTTIEDYISQYSPETQDILNNICGVIRRAAPQASEKISWGMPTFVLNGNLVHFAAQKMHTGFYPAPSAIEAFSEELTEYHCSKGAVQFPFAKPLPVELIDRMVRFRVEEQLKIKSEK